MKRVVTCLLALLCAAALPMYAAAAQPEARTAVESIRIGWEEAPLELSGLPRAPYYEGESLMVPLRRIGEALGYRVSWDAATGAITMDDDYIQMATLHDGSAEAVFQGRLQVIDLSRTVENEQKTVIVDGCTYVPLRFFREFLNDTEVDGAVVRIAPSRAEVCGGAA